MGEDSLASGLGSTVGERELEVLGEELLDVRTADEVLVGDLDDLQDLFGAKKKDNDQYIVLARKRPVSAPG